MTTRGYNLLGLKFGNLTVISRHKFPPSPKVHWKCNCVCGKQTFIQTQKLTSFGQLDCGHCKYVETKADAYSSWKNARQRCKNPKHPKYSDYGGRGITFSSEWDDFLVFYHELGDPPIDPMTGNRMTLDRIDNNKGYESGNCKWSTHSEQMKNRRTYTHSK